MASTHHLLRALADRPDELALLLRSEYRPRQTLLHHAAAVGDAALADALLAYDPSLAQVEWEEGSIYYCKPWANAPMAAVASLQPAAVRTLLPHSWPPHQQQQQQPGEKQQPSGTSSSSGGTSAGLGGGRQAPPTDARTFQVGLLARLLHSIAAWEEWPSWQCGIGYKDWQEWPAPPQPRPAALRQQAEATLVALLEGPQGVDINTCAQYEEGSGELYVGSALDIAVANCPPWVALLRRRHGASPASCAARIVVLHLGATRRRHPSDDHVQLLEALLQAGEPASYVAVCRLAEVACDCEAAHKGLEAHIGRCHAMLRLLLQHGAPLQGAAADGSLIEAALDRLVDSIGCWPRWDNKVPSAAAAAAALLEQFAAALTEAGYRDPKDVAGCAMESLQKMFHVIRDSGLGREHDRARWDAASLQRCLRVLRAVCAPSSAQQAQQLLHDVIRCAIYNVASVPQRPWIWMEAPEPVLSVPDRQQELHCWLAAMRFAVEIGADANGSWEGVHTLRHTLTCTARVWYGWRDEWGGDASRLATAAASEIVALLVEMGAQPSDDRASGEDKPLAWLAMDLWHPDILHLLLAAGLAVPRMFCGQSALDYLLHEYGKRGLNYLIGYLYSLAKLQPEVTLQALRVAHTWALLAEAGCPHSVPLPNLAMYLGDLKMQNQAGWVWVLAEGIPWTPRLHFLFPPAFRAAACTLLLVNHRGVPAASLGSCSSISQKRQQKKPNQRARAQQQQALQLPAAAVQRVLCLAAASLSSWLPPLPSCRLPAEA